MRKDVLSALLAIVLLGVATVNAASNAQGQPFQELQSQIDDIISGAVSVGSIEWGDILNIPPDIDDGDDDTNASTECSAGEYLDGDGYCYTVPVDTDTQLSEAAVESYVTNGPLNLDAGTTLGGASISTGAHTVDTDTLGGLSCSINQVAKWDGTSWSCAADNTGTGGDSDWTISGNDMYSGVSGNVGIGTTSPIEDLHIVDSAGATGAWAWGSDLLIDSGASQRFITMRGPNSGQTGILFSNSDSHIDGGLRYWATTGAERLDLISGSNVSLSVKGNGNVGIGTNFPLSKLAVIGLPTSPPDASGNAGVVCATNNGNLWLDNDGTNDCL